MLSMRKENSYNSVVSSMERRDRTQNDMTKKIGRYDRGNIGETNVSTRSWVKDRTMRMK